jgi:hypothetical protein
MTVNPGGLRSLEPEGPHQRSICDRYYVSISANHPGVPSETAARESTASAS